MPEVPDLLVVGGGPVGLVTALEAAARSLDVQILEPRVGPVDKACGEGLMAAGRNQLADLGVDPAGREFLGIVYLDAMGARAARARLPQPGLGIRRTTLHEALQHAVHDRGIPVIAGKLADLYQDSQYVTVAAHDAGREMELTARYVVGADGLHSRVRRVVGSQGRRSRLRRHGIRQHLVAGPWSDDVEVYWSRIGEAYVTPVSDTEVGVAILTGLSGSFIDLLGHFPALLDRVGHAVPASRVMGSGPLRQRVRRRVRGRVLLVGDAAGYVDALTGDGLTLGFTQARSAVDAVVRRQPLRYELTCRRDSLVPQAAAWALVHGTSTATAKALMPGIAAQAPGTFERFLRVAAGP